LPSRQRGLSVNLRPRVLSVNVLLVWVFIVFIHELIVNPADVPRGHALARLMKATWRSVIDRVMWPLPLTSSQ
jgi:hypothetical protein